MEDVHQKFELANAIQSKTSKINKRILKTKLLYRYDIKNPTNFNNYINGIHNLLLTIKTKKNIFGSFSTSKI